MPYTPGEKAMVGDICQRLRGRYPSGPMLPNGEPEFGWRQFDGLPGLGYFPPILEEAAMEIERLRGIVLELVKQANGCDPGCSSKKCACIRRTNLLIEK